MIQAQLTEEQTTDARLAAERHVPRPVTVAALFYTVVTLVLMIVAYRACDGHLVYPIDDSYITMAMAKNLALHGVWGVSPYGFSSSSSSILYPLLLGGVYRVVGVNEVAPFALSWLFGLGAIFVAGRIVKDFLDQKWQTVVLILMVLFTPLFVLGMLGMEHALHLLLTLLFLEYFLRQELGERLVRLGAITTLMVATRYEGLFFVALAFCLLAGQRRWRAAITMAAAAVAPVCAYAWFSVAHGGSWLPNSVALKGVGGQGGSGFGYAELARISMNYREGFHLLVMLALEAVVLAAMSRRVAHRAFAPLALVLGAGCIHFCTARVGWVFRYEDYLIGAGIVLLACIFPALWETAPKSGFMLARVLLLATCALLLVRSLIPAALLPLYARNVYWQQWQMAHLVRSNFAQATIAANDIGAIEYFSDARCIDLVGLANDEVFRARRTGSYTTEFLRQETEGQQAKIAMVYDSWFMPGTRNALGPSSIPASWVRVARWSTPETLQLGARTVSFYAIDAGSAEEVRDALDRYAVQLPRSVVVSRH